MDSPEYNRKASTAAAGLIALLFLLLTTGLMTAVLFGIARGVLPEAAVLLGLFGPALAAIAFTAAEQDARMGDLLRQYLRLRAPLTVYLVALLTVPLLLLATQQLVSLVLPELDWVRFAALSVPQMIFIPLISIGEELGWRGYLQPRMRRYFSLATASAIVGVVWALWHLPGYYFNTGVVDGVSFVWFAAWVVSGAMIMGWLYERSSSVFIAVLFHTITNASFNMILIMPPETASSVPFKIFVIAAALSATVITLLATRNPQSAHPRHVKSIGNRYTSPQTL